MGDNKVTLREKYDYKSKMPDRYQSIGVAMAITVYAYSNKLKKNKAIVLPVSIGIGFVFGSAISYFLTEKSRRRMLMVEDYMDRHPEEFAVPSALKYKDLLLPWSPER